MSNQSINQQQPTVKTISIEQLRTQFQTLLQAINDRIAADEEDLADQLERMSRDLLRQSVSLRDHKMLGDGISANNARAINDLMSRIYARREERRNLRNLMNSMR